MKPQHRKLPKSMRHKTLDLRDSNQLSSSETVAGDSVNDSNPQYVRYTDIRSQHQPAKSGQVKGSNFDAPNIVPVGLQHKPEKVEKKHRKFVTVLLVLIVSILLVAATYIVWLMLSPKTHKSSQQDIQQATDKAIAEDKDMLLIPSVGIKSEISDGDVSILDKGLAWHRLPDRGNPAKGGNTILTGHSFVWGYTPKQVEEQSIFFNLHDAKVGDDIKVVWDKKTYNYKIAEVKNVKPNATEIESETKAAQLTIYTCTSGGSADGRVVVIAKPSSWICDSISYTRY